jgi:hypothetical protein
MGAVDFNDAVFKAAAGFLGDTFSADTSFGGAKFNRVAQFSFSRFGNDPDKQGPISDKGPFSLSEFFGEGIFRNTKFEELAFFRTSFRDGVDFHKARGGKLSFQSTSVTGRANIDDATLDEFGLYSAYQQTRIDGDISFRGSSIDNLHFDRVVFKRGVDFQEASFKSNFDISQGFFGEDVRLDGARLPDAVTGKRAFAFDDVTLDKGLFIDADQWFSDASWWAFWRENQPRIDAANPDFEDQEVAKQRQFWREMGRAFALAGNLQLKNDAEYRVQQIIEPDLPQPQRLFSALSRWFWGYGVRPARVFIWFAVSLSAFALLYWTQLGSSNPRTEGFRRALTRAKQATVFSWRTSWELKFGYEHSVTDAFRAVTVVQSVLSKLLLACFAYSLTQTSPLLSDLMRKLLP